MTGGLVRQALRRHPWSFAGPAVTQFLAGAIIAGALGGNASVRDAPLDPVARQALQADGVLDIPIVFVLISVYLTVLIVGITMTTAIARQARDIALARAIGATPGRVRRAIAVQAAVVAVPATLLGLPFGAVLGRLWIDGLVGHGVLPAAVHFHTSAAAIPVALAVTVVTSLTGALIAAVRPSRISPSVALAETAVGGRRGGKVRTAAGLVMTAGGIVLSVATANSDPKVAAQESFFVTLAMCVGAGLLGPVLLRVASPVARAFGGVGALAADNLAVRARALSGALVPLVLAVAFAATKVVMHATSAHVHGVPDPAEDLWTDYAGTSVYVAFAAIAALNTLVTVLLSRRRELAVVRLTGGARLRTLAMVVCEALVVTATGLVAAAGVALAVLLPWLHVALGTWVPYLPPGEFVVGVLGVAALVGLGTAVPAGLAMCRPAVESIAVDP